MHLQRVVDHVEAEGDDHNGGKRQRPVRAVGKLEIAGAQKRASGQDHAALTEPAHKQLHRRHIEQPADSEGAKYRTDRAEGKTEPLVQIGALAQVTYHWSDQLKTTAYVEYKRLVGDATRSPIVRPFGSRDSITVGVSASYAFDLGL